jgi:hypothetical protein
MPGLRVASWSVVWVLAALAGIGARVTSVEGQRVEGQVVADGTRAPVMGAQVVLVDVDGVGRASMRTDSIGAFTLDAPGAGRYRLRVERPGYQPYDSPVLPLERGETIAVEVRLGPGAIPLEPLVVVGRSRPLPGRATEFHERRNHPARTGFFITREDMEKNGLGARTSDVLVRAPGVVLTPIPGYQPGAIPGFRVNMLGSAAGEMDGVCTPALFLDGAPLRQAGGFSIDDVLDPSTLEGIEVYSRMAAAPVQYAMGNDCGVVLFWTQLPEQGNDWNWKRLTVGAAAAAGLLFLMLFR